jgi:hypothetical protein
MASLDIIPTAATLPLKTTGYHQTLGLSLTGQAVGAGAKTVRGGRMGYSQSCSRWKVQSLNIVVSLALALPGDILNMLNGRLKLQLNSIADKNTP